MVPGADSVASARENLQKLLDGFNGHEVIRPLSFNTQKYEYWGHAERFWFWFKQFHRGGWKDYEEELRDAMIIVTYRHYSGMDSVDIEKEVRSVLSVFLFDWGNVPPEEKERLSRFHKYLSSLHAVLG